MRKKRSTRSKEDMAELKTACESCDIGSPSVHTFYESAKCDSEENYELFSQVSCNCAERKFTESDVAKIGPSCQDITDLYLDSNNIEEITEYTFKEKGYLRFLSMQNNGLKKIHEKAFLHLNKLQQIRLENNELESLPGKLFEQNVDLQTIYLMNNKIHSLGDGIFYNLLNLVDLRLSHNYIQNLHQQAFKDVGKLSMLYLDHNNLTTIHKEWFENFHTRWTREEHGQIFLDPNPWVCDCSSTDFHNFQIDNEFFHDKYSRDEGYVSLGSCQYPHTLRGKKFEDLTTTDVEGESEGGKGRGRNGLGDGRWCSPPMVEFIVRDASNHSVQIDDFEQTPLLMENLDEAHNGPAIKHSIRVLDHTIQQLTVIVTVTSTLAQFSDPIHDQFSVEIDNANESGYFAKLFWLFIFSALFYAIYTNREMILRKLRSFVPVQAPSSPAQDQTVNYSHLPEHDNAALVSNEQLYEPETPQELKINV
ncbi:Oidioi.mRNA.OKI2018_I69.chr1.g953.t1.cds [Oikopleura dioica]|uniref:Oidioi.mRNA.OKI2018_I69.chr1.g953.t1.cds n=1 Tax=Oikopleura dioica TaxID=34765 RepID=A0ABN7SQP5_OIKDI|nr:Oidioi.mRNA.OKI2018_I69.chr1.g953.t1.cds [Oikopleura dioica]